MNTCHLTRVIAGVIATLALSVGAAMADGGKAGAAPCPYAGPGVSLCAKVGATLHACVQDTSCDKKSTSKKSAAKESAVKESSAKKSASKKGGSRSGLGFLGRLFI